jgi:hypothetical protein
MGFPLPLPGFCKWSGKRKWEVAGAQRGPPNCDVENGRGEVQGWSVRGERSGNGEAVSVGGFDDETGCGHGGEALIESGGADAA